MSETLSRELHCKPRLELPVAVLLFVCVRAKSSDDSCRGHAISVSKAAFSCIHEPIEITSSLRPR